MAFLKNKIVRSILENTVRFLPDRMVVMLQY